MVCSDLGLAYTSTLFDAQNRPVYWWSSEHQSSARSCLLVCLRCITVSWYQNLSYHQWQVISNVAWLVRVPQSLHAQCCSLAGISCFTPILYYPATQQTVDTVPSSTPQGFSHYKPPSSDCLQCDVCHWVAWDYHLLRKLVHVFSTMDDFELVLDPTSWVASWRLYCQWHCVWDCSRGAVELLHVPNLNRTCIELFTPLKFIPFVIISFLAEHLNKV